MPNGCRTFSPGHDFDPVSGWCAHGCGHRDDGRMFINSRGVVAEGPDYTPEQLHEFRTKGQSR